MHPNRHFQSWSAGAVVQPGFDAKSLRAYEISGSHGSVAEKTGMLAAQRQATTPTGPFAFLTSLHFDDRTKIICAPGC